MSFRSRQDYGPPEQPPGTYPDGSIIPQIERGEDLVPIPVANVNTPFPVVFDTPFPAGVIPIVVCHAVTNTPAVRFASGTVITETGFTVTAINTAAANSVRFAYVAVAP